MYEEDVANFDDEDHMNYVGEFYFKVNETCLHGDHNIFMVAPNDRDAHNPILVHLNPSDMTWNERAKYKPGQMKMKRKQQRKETQRQKETPREKETESKKETQRKKETESEGDIRRQQETTGDIRRQQET